MTAACGAGTDGGGARRRARRAGSAGGPAGLGHGRRRVGGRPQRRAPPRLRAGTGHPAPDRRGHRGRPRGQGGRANGQERERLRPGPPPGRLARHARPDGRRDPPHPSPPGRRRVVPGPRGRATPSRCSERSTGRSASCGTGRRRGPASRATPAISAGKPREHGLEEVAGPPSLPPHRSSVPPGRPAGPDGHLRGRDRCRRRASGPAGRGAAAVARSGRPPPRSSAPASTRPAASTPAATRSSADRVTGTRHRWRVAVALRLAAGRK